MLSALTYLRDRLIPIKLHGKETNRYKTQAKFGRESRPQIQRYITTNLNLNKHNHLQKTHCQLTSQNPHN